MRNTFAALAVASTLTLLGCKTIETPDGRVPAEFLPYAKQLVGDYQGKFEKTNGTLRLSLQGDRPMLEFVANNGGRDILPGCNSRIGQLRNIVGAGQEGSYELKSASFAFDRGTCQQIEGNEITLSFRIRKETVKINARVLLRTEQQWETSCTHGPDGPDCIDYLRTVQVNLTGKFQN